MRFSRAHDLVLQLGVVLNPIKPVNVTDVDAFSVAFGLAPWLAELVLAFRLLVVYPPRRTSARKLILVFAFPVAAKIVRLACVANYYHRFITVSQKSGTPLQAAQAGNYRHSPYTITEFFLQIFDTL